MDTFVTGFIACAALIGILRFALMMAPMHDPDWPHRMGSNPPPPEVSRRPSPPPRPPSRQFHRCEHSPPCPGAGYQPFDMGERGPFESPPIDP